jgi:hypothetical protein
MRNRLAEQPREGFLIAVLQVRLAAKKDHLVAQQCGANRFDGCRFELARQAHAANFRANAAGDRLNVQCVGRRETEIRHARQLLGSRTMPRSNQC